MVASLYSSCVFGCRHGWVWAVRKCVGLAGAGSCTHSRLICITVFLHLYLAMVDVCGFLGQVDLYVFDTCKGVVAMRWGVGSVCREGSVEGVVAGGRRKCFQG